jgi:hypothetical protein
MTEAGKRTIRNPDETNQSGKLRIAFRKKARGGRDQPGRRDHTGARVHAPFTATSTLTSTFGANVIPR